MLRAVVIVEGPSYKVCEIGRRMAGRTWGINNYDLRLHCGSPLIEEEDEGEEEEANLRIMPIRYLSRDSLPSLDA